MSAPASPRQMANGLDAWAGKLAGRHLGGEMLSPLVGELRRAAALIRERADELERFRESRAYAVGFNDGHHCAEQDIRDRDEGGVPA